MPYNFFSNINCEYYPCHTMPDGEDINCLFCFCPVYNNIVCPGAKDCSKCNYPHKKENYINIINLLCPT